MDITYTETVWLSKFLNDVFLRQIASPGPIRGMYFGKISIFVEYSWRYSNMKSSPLCKIHRGIDKKESILKSFEFIFIMLYDKSVHLGSVF